MHSKLQEFTHQNNRYAIDECKLQPAKVFNTSEPAQPEQNQGKNLALAALEEAIDRGIEEV